MATVWKGSISFGLVHIGVALSKAIGDPDEIELHQYDRASGSRIRQKRVSEATGKEVPYADIVRGWDPGDGKVVLINEDDLERFTSDRNIELLSKVPWGSLDPILLDGAYNVVPTEGSEKAFALLFSTMVARGDGLVGKITMRSRPKLVAFQAHQNADGLAVRMHTLRYAETIRPSERVAPADLADAEIDLAAKLLDALDVGFDANAHADPYTTTLSAYLARAAKGLPVEAPEDGAEGAGEGVSDLMAALEASVEAAKAARAES